MEATWEGKVSGEKGSREGSEEIEETRSKEEEPSERDGETETGEGETNHEGEGRVSRSSGALPE